MKLRKTSEVNFDLVQPQLVSYVHNHFGSQISKDCSLFRCGPAANHKKLIGLCEIPRKESVGTVLPIVGNLYGDELKGGP